MDDSEGEHLKDTPRRVATHLKDICSGYKDFDISKITTTFNSQGYDEIIILKDINFYSTCSHHLLNFSGKVHLGYLPNKKIIGISKLARIVEIYAKRLQVQEQMTKQIVEVVEYILKPKGVACVVEGAHLCIQSRGVKQQNAIMITSSMRGVFRRSQAARNEFLRLIGK